MSTLESIPQVWDDESDVAFFTIVARLFRPDFTFGAGVLLASFDPRQADDELLSSARRTSLVLT